MTEPGVILNAQAQPPQQQKEKADDIPAWVYKAVLPALVAVLCLLVTWVGARITTGVDGMSEEVSTLARQTAVIIAQLEGHERRIQRLEASQDGSWRKPGPMGP